MAEFVVAGHPPGQTGSGAIWAHAMRTGDFARAWAINDAVLAARDPASSDDPRLPYHQRWVWTGVPPDGREVLVRCYHGLGDTIQFARFLPALRARAARVTVEVQPELMELLATCAGIDQLVPFNLAAPSPPTPCTLEIMELAHVLRVSEADVAGDGAYLEAKIAPPSWASGRIGLCWRAGDWDASRSTTLQHMIARFAEGEKCVSLQRGSSADEAGVGDFINPADAEMRIAYTASLVAACRKIVTVDTMVAHLAGALGAPGTVLLKPEPDWRWAEHEHRSLWYPTLRLADLS